MVDVVDSIVAELEVRLGSYVTNFNKAADAHERFTKTRPDKAAQFSTAEIERYSNRHKQAGDVVVQSSEKASRATKKRSADEITAEKAAAAAVKQAAKEKEAAAKSAAREQEKAARDAERAAQRVAAAEERAAARAAASSEAQRRRSTERIAQLRAEEQATTNQVKANTFLTGYRPAAGQRGDGGLSGGSAKASASVFQEQFRAEERQAKEAAAAEAILAREREKAGNAAATAGAKETQRDANASRRVIREPNVAPAAGGGRIGATVPREATGQRSIPSSVLSGAASAEVAAEAEVNHLLADQADLQARLAILSGQDKAQIRDKVQELRYVKQLQSAGLDEAAIALRLDERALLVARERAAVSSKQKQAAVGNFAKGAGLGRVGGGAAAIGGIAVAAGAYAGYSAVESAVDDAKVLKAQSEQLGLNTRDLQIYQVAADRANVSQEQFRSSIAQLTGALGKAQEGGEEQAKVFRALNIDIGNSRDGFKTTSQILPELINRLSGISDPARRAAVETALLGEEGRRLDSLLSGGIDSINQLGDALDRAGSILTPAELDQLTQAGRVLADVKRQLSVDLSRIVAGNSDAIQALAHTFEFLADRIGGAIQKYSAYLKITSGAATPLEAAAAFAVGAVTGTGPGLQAQTMTADARASLEKIRPTGASVNQKALDTLFAPKPAKGPKGKSADQLANEADERTRRFNDIMGRLYDEQQRAVAEQTQNEYERSDLEKRQIERDRDREVDDLKLRAQQDIRKGADAKLTNARLAQATAATQAAAAERLNVISLRDTVEGLTRTSASRQRSYDLQATLLSDMEGLARTQSERRRIAEQQRDLDRKRETDSANLVIDRAANGDPSVSTTDLEGARNTLRTQDQRFAGRKAGDDRQTAGPIENYLSSVPRDVDQINERFQQAAVDGVGRLNDSLTDTATKFLHLHGLAGQFIADIIRIGIERETASLLFGNGKGGGSGLGNVIKGAAGLFHFATGGSGIIQGNAGVDTNTLSLNGSPVARVSSGERLSISPNLGVAPKGPVSSVRTSVLVVQPIHADFSGARTDEQTLAQFQQYADARSTQAYKAAVDTAGGQVPGIVQRKSQLG